MITKDDEKIVESIKKYIDQQAMVGETKVDWEKIRWIETLDRLVNNLHIAVVSVSVFINNLKYKLCQ